MSRLSTGVCMKDDMVWPVFDQSFEKKPNIGKQGDAR
jgi:hypothetical protein